MTMEAAAAWSLVSVLVGVLVFRNVRAYLRSDDEMDQAAVRVRISAGAWFFLTVGQVAGLVLLLALQAALARRLGHPPHDTGEIVVCLALLCFALGGTACFLRIAAQWASSTYDVSGRAIRAADGNFREVWSELIRVEVPALTRVRLTFASGRAIELHDRMNGWHAALEIVRRVAGEGRISGGDARHLDRILRGAG